MSNPRTRPTRPWQRLHVDFASPFNGGMFLIVVDTKSKWMEVIPMSFTSASATIRALRSLFATHGLPEEIVADNGPQFVAGEMKDFLTANGVRLCWSSPYHPASNREAERAVWTFKEAMRIIEIGSISVELPNHTPYSHWMSTSRNFNGAEIANEA